MSCLSHSVIKIHYVTAEAIPYIFQVIYSIRTTSFGSSIIRLLLSRPYSWLWMVRIAEFKGLYLIRLRLFYNSIAIELISVPIMLPKLCQLSLGMVIYHFLSNPDVVLNLNPYRKTLSSLYDLVKLPNHV